VNLTVPCDATVTVSATVALTHQCPFRDEVDEGIVTITWTTAGKTLELHALTSWLNGFARTAISHEDLTEEVDERLAALPGIARVYVTSRWTTGRAKVVVTNVVPRERQLGPGA
jgi:NADPH-dependent 7-cyano-7-deazaguanine reductase QueF